MTNEKLEAAFRDFDTDNDGCIKAHEIKAALSNEDDEIDDEVWKKILDEVDQDGNGEIDLMEFQIMMRNLIMDEGNMDGEDHLKPKADDSF